MHTRYFIILVFFLFSISAVAQTKLTGGGSIRGNSNDNDSTSLNRSNGFAKLATIDMYVEFNHVLDSTQIDTTITIKKEKKLK
tara:strand:+ start:460 stop:708 length:249 start_codon:yes stop_codon:yes gene_type:complete